MLPVRQTDLSTFTLQATVEGTTHAHDVQCDDVAAGRRAAGHGQPPPTERVAAKPQGMNYRVGEGRGQQGLATDFRQTVKPPCLTSAKADRDEAAEPGPGSMPATSRGQRPHPAVWAEQAADSGDGGTKEYRPAALPPGPIHGTDTKEQAVSAGHHGECTGQPCEDSGRDEDGTSTNVQWLATRQAVLAYMETDDFWQLDAKTKECISSSLAELQYHIEGSSHHVGD